MNRAAAARSLLLVSPLAPTVDALWCAVTQMGCNEDATAQRSGTGMGIYNERPAKM